MFVLMSNIVYVLNHMFESGPCACALAEYVEEEEEDDDERTLLLRGMRGDHLLSRRLLLPLPSPHPPADCLSICH